jgi:uncharacterized protein with beta-barrel porin domain
MPQFRRIGLALATLAGSALVPPSLMQSTAQELDSFAVLAGSAVTDAGASVINGNVGVSPGNSITGFPPAIVNAPYTIYNNEAVAAGAQSQLTTAYNLLAGRPTTADLTGQDLGGMILGGGVYNFNSSAQLTGQLTLDGGGDPNTIFIFNIGSTLTTAAASSIVLANGADPNKVFFRVGSSATLGSTTQFVGKILALTSITLVTGASINCGAALARNGAVTLDSNVINICIARPVVIDETVLDEVAETDQEVIDAINAYVAAGNVLPIGFAVLALLTPAELAAALDQLSGETATAATPAAIQSMNSFINLLNRRTGSPAGDVASAPFRPATVSVMGYAAQRPAPGGSAFDGFDGAAMPDINQWQIWSAAYGGYTVTSGDSVKGSHDRKLVDYGLAFGFERYLTTDTMFGLAVSGGGTNFDLDNSLGSGKSAMLQAAIYGRSDRDQAYISGALAYGIHAMRTERSVTIAGIDRFVADFYTHNIAADVEVGYKVGWLTPFAALRGQVVSTPGYQEKTVSGASTFALGYQDQVALNGRVEIGARADWTIDVEAGTLSTYASAAWAHQLSTHNSVKSYFLALPGSTTTVAGANPGANSVLLGVGTELRLDSGLSLSGGLDAAWSHNALGYSGNARLAYRW